MSAWSKWWRLVLRGLRAFAYPGSERVGRPRGRPLLGLALGGGFARGIAHVGVLRTLERHHIPVDLIAGTSVGALIGAAYASGATTEEMERMGVTTRFRDFGRWKLSRMGMASNERLRDYLRKFTTVNRFDELKIPLSIVATDIVTGQSVYFTRGEIGPALQASCAYPGLFLPVEYEGHVLVDGFLTAVVPAHAVHKMGADIVIAVHLEPGLLGEKPRNTIEVISRSFSIIQGYATAQWRSASDIVVEPDVRHILWDDFARTPELVAAGEAATEAVIPQLRLLLRGRGRGALERPDARAAETKR
jgi:NTE family protein